MTQTQNIKKINFVTENEAQRWILRRWCESFRPHIPLSTVTSMKPDENADANVYVNYALYKPTNTLDIAVFTHRENENFDIIAEKCDWCFGQSDYTMSLLPENKSSRLIVGVDKQFLLKRPVRIGVIGRGYSSGRKRLDWIPRLERDGIEIILTGGAIPYKKMPQFYDQCDYVLVTSSLEGGSMVAPEAIARYKPLIVPWDVGWFNEFPAIRYNTYEDLEEIIKRLVPSRNGWKLGARQIIDKVNELLD